MIEIDQYTNMSTQDLERASEQDRDNLDLRYRLIQRKCKEFKTYEAQELLNECKDKGDLQFRYKFHTLLARVMVANNAKGNNAVKGYKDAFLQCLKAQNMIESEEENPSMRFMSMIINRATIKVVPKHVFQAIPRKIENQYAFRSFLTTCRRWTTIQFQRQVEQVIQNILEKKEQIEKRKELEKKKEEKQIEKQQEENQEENREEYNEDKKEKVKKQ